MAPPPTLNPLSTYLTLTFPPTSPFLPNPALLARRAPDSLPAITYVSQVGELEDVHIYQVGVDRAHWDGVKEQVLKGLGGVEGVAGVKVLEVPKMRVKRGEEL